MGITYALTYHDDLHPTDIDRLELQYAAEIGARRLRVLVQTTRYQPTEAEQRLLDAYDATNRAGSRYLTAAAEVDRIEYYQAWDDDEEQADYDECRNDKEQAEQDIRVTTLDLIAAHAALGHNPYR